MTAISVYIMLDMMDLIIIWYVLTRCIIAWYFKVNSVSKWWLAFVPFGATFVFKTEVVYIPTWTVVTLIVMTILTFISPFPYWILYRAATYCKDYFVAPAIYSGRPQLYMFIPGYRYYLMIKDCIWMTKRR